MLFNKSVKINLEQMRKIMTYCKQCGRRYNSKERFIIIIENNPKDDYKEMLASSEFCSNRCEFVNKNWKVLSDWYLST